MNYSVIKYGDMINGRGIRVSLFLTGCSHRCKGCFNPSTWNPQTGYSFTENSENEILGYFKKYGGSLSGLSLLGGDPTFHSNIEPLKNFIQKFKREFPEKDIWIWSGYTWEEILSNNSLLELISLCNVLVDGKFSLEEREISLQWRGSKNQRIIDIEKSVSKKEAILWR